MGVYGFSHFDYRYPYAFPRCKLIKGDKYINQYLLEKIFYNILVKTLSWLVFEVSHLDIWPFYMYLKVSNLEATFALNGFWSPTVV